MISALTENERTVTGMDEYIERETIIERLKKNLAASKPGSWEELCYHDAINSVNGIPAADVAPVLHGRWENVKETEMYVPDMKLTITKTAETCSECKARIGFVGAKQYLFDTLCPSCGARMNDA